MPLSSFAPVQSLFAKPILLLFLTTLFWAGNTIAGRLAVGEVSPLAVVFLRWVAVSGLMVALYGRQVRAEWPILKAHLPVMILMGIFGFTAFNSLFYIAAHSTTALNLGIIQGSMPMFVLLGALVILRTPIRAVQAIGVAITMAGVVFIASQGDLSRLTELEINPGDGLMILACLLYSLYAVLLRNRPAVSGMVFFTVLSVVAAITSVPVFLVELWQGATQMPTAKGWLIVAYISVFPSFLSQIFFMRGVDLIGPGRAGVFINLVPILSSILAVGLLGEPFHFYHAAALALVLVGIALSERKSAASRAGASAPGGGAQ
ncbi:DMT family transporter [Stappia sp.]|uniref:DMT family transporter n=1 Tax=Stappia sp. TaxID=1870903 RepID=UPI0032D97DEE